MTTPEDGGETTPSVPSHAPTLDSIQKLMESMLEKSEKRLEDKIAKLASSPPKEPSVTVDEDRNPLKPDLEASRESSPKDSRNIKYLYNNAPNV